MTSTIFDLTGRTALVTGSSRGIGLAVARGLLDAGAQVVLNGRDPDTLARARASLGHEARVHASVFDVTDEAAVIAAIETVEHTVAPVDILVNNTGIQIRAPLDQFATADFQRIVATNLTSAFVVARTVARSMIRRARGGKIINVLSVNAEHARASIAPYSATKGGLKMLTKGMCVDWARHGIQVNGLAPGYFATEMNRALVDDAEFSAWVTRRVPTGRWGKVEELQGAAVFLASAASDFVNGHVLVVDGGMIAGL